MLSKMITINNKEYEVRITNNLCVDSYVEYNIHFFDGTKCVYCWIQKEWKNDIPKYIEKVKEASEAFKEQMDREARWEQAIKDFEEWDGKF